jgi:hypothetical protein
VHGGVYLKKGIIESADGKKRIGCNRRTVVFLGYFYGHIIHVKRKNFSRVKEKTKEEEDRNSMKRRLIIYLFIIIDTMLRYTICSCKIRKL